MRCKRVFSFCVGQGRCPTQNGLSWLVSDTNLFAAAGIRHKMICCEWYPTQTYLLRLVSDTKCSVAAGIRHKMSCRCWNPTRNDLSGSGTNLFWADWFPILLKLFTTTGSNWFCCWLIPDIDMNIDCLVVTWQHNTDGLVIIVSFLPDHARQLELF